MTDCTFRDRGCCGIWSYCQANIYISTIAIVGADIVAIGSRFLGFNKF
jgi:hypothetical protein